MDAGMGKAASEASADPESGFKPSDTVWVWCCAFRPPDVSAFLWQMSVARQLLWCEGADRTVDPPPSSLPPALAALPRDPPARVCVF